MLAALANAQAAPVAPTARKNRRKGKGSRPYLKTKVDLASGTTEVVECPKTFARPVPAGFDNTMAEFDAMLEKAYGPAPVVTKPAVPFKAYNADGSVFLGEEVLARAAELKAERKAEAKAAAAEARKIRNAEKRALGLPLRAPAKKKVLTGRDIPAEIRGRISVTGTINAKTGEALVIDVTFRNTTHSGIIVWAGDIQPIVAEAAKKNKALDLVIAQPSNDRFKPSVRRAA